MEMFWLALILALVVVVGNAMLLLRTARRPKLPGLADPRPRQDGEDEK